MFILVIEIGLIVAAAVTLIVGGEIWLVLSICGLVYVIGSFHNNRVVRNEYYQSTKRLK